MLCLGLHRHHCGRGVSPLGQDAGNLEITLIQHREKGKKVPKLEKPRLLELSRELVVPLSWFWSFPSRPHPDSNPAPASVPQHHHSEALGSPGVLPMHRPATTSHTRRPSKLKDSQQSPQDAHFVAMTPEEPAYYCTEVGQFIGLLFVADWLLCGCPRSEPAVCVGRPQMVNCNPGTSGSESFPQCQACLA